MKKSKRCVDFTSPAALRCENVQWNNLDAAVGNIGLSTKSNNRYFRNRRGVSGSNHPLFDGNKIVRCLFDLSGTELDLNGNPHPTWSRYDSVDLKIAGIVIVIKAHSVCPRIDP